MNQSSKSNSSEKGNFFGRLYYDLISNLNHIVFWPPFLLLIGAVILNLTRPKQFESMINSAQSWVLENGGWLFLAVGFAAFLLSVFICVSKFGDVRIGGKDAKPKLKMWNWFAITICTTIAVGALLWATAEPMAHFINPPKSKGIEPASAESARFALSTMFLHWSFTPYAIYAVASLMFAFAYYNMRKPFSLGSPLSPLLGDRVSGVPGKLIDAVCLYALVAGMAATLGGGILTIAGGLNHLSDSFDPESKWLRGLIALAIIATFIVSSASGLMNGIRILSSINTYALFAMGIFIFIFGPATLFVLNFGLESFGVYLTHFFEMNLFSDTVEVQQMVEVTEGKATPWTHSWTIFYWAVWIAWTPITACFLGQIAYGRTVREFMLVNFILPSLFAIAWMSIFSGTAIYLEIENPGMLTSIYPGDGTGGNAEAVIFKVFEFVPFTFLMVVFFVLSTFICFVTSADSNTTAMAGISSTGITPENSEGNVLIKIAWGVTVGLVAWVMITFADVEGIKTLSILGGFPVSFLMIAMILSLFKVTLDPQRYNLIDEEKPGKTDRG